MAMEAFVLIQSVTIMHNLQIFIMGSIFAIFPTPNSTTEISNLTGQFGKQIIAAVLNYHFITKLQKLISCQTCLLYKFVNLQRPR